jgi:hypothetical protein
MGPPEGSASSEPDEDTKQQTRSKMPGHTNFLQFQKRLAEQIGTDLGSNPQPAQSPELDDLEPGDPSRILNWARETNYDVKDPVSPRVLTEFITGRKPPQPGQSQQAQMMQPRPQGAPTPPPSGGGRRDMDADAGNIQTGSPALQNVPQQGVGGVAANVPMTPTAPQDSGGAFRSSEQAEGYRRRPEAARGGEPSQGPSRATGSAVDRAGQEIRLNRQQADRPGGFTAPGETVGELPEGTNYMRYLAEESFTGDMADKAAEVRGGPPRGGTPNPPPSGRTGGALPEQQGGDMSAAAQDQDQAAGPRRIPQIPGGGQGGAFQPGEPETPTGMPLPTISGTLQDVGRQPQRSDQQQGAVRQGEGGRILTTPMDGGGQTGDRQTPPTPGQRPQAQADEARRRDAVAPGGANTGGRAGPGPERPGPGGQASGGAAGPGPMGEALQQRSPTFRKMTEDPAGTMKEAGFNVNETFNKLMKEIGREPEEASLDEDQKARLMMEMGLRMMTQSGKPGATFLGAIGNAGLNTMQTAQAMKQQDRKQKQRASERRQQALQTKLDVGLQREQMAAETARAQQEQAFEAWQNQLDRDTELELERLENQYGGGENMGSFAKRVWFYENQLGLPREEAVSRAEATGSASPRNLRMEAQQTFFDLMESNPQALEPYGYDYSNPGETQDAARQQFIESYTQGVQPSGAQTSGQQQGGSGAPPSNVLSWARQQEGAQRVRRQNGQWGAVTSDGEFIPYQE